MCLQMRNLKYSTQRTEDVRPRRECGAQRLPGLCGTFCLPWVASGPATNARPVVGVCVCDAHLAVPCLHCFLCDLPNQQSGRPHLGLQSPVSCCVLPRSARQHRLLPHPQNDISSPQARQEREVESMEPNLPLNCGGGLWSGNEPPWGRGQGAKHVRPGGKSI